MLSICEKFYKQNNGICWINLLKNINIEVILNMNEEIIIENRMCEIFKILLLVTLELVINFAMMLNCSCHSRIFYTSNRSLTNFAIV
jgi:hypothetical protein